MNTDVVPAWLRQQSIDGRNVTSSPIIGSMKRPDELVVPLFLPEWPCF